jgi:hypothetical protein
VVNNYDKQKTRTLCNKKSTDFFFWNTFKQYLQYHREHLEEENTLQLPKVTNIINASQADPRKLNGKINQTSVDQTLINYRNKNCPFTRTETVNPKEWNQYPFFFFFLFLIGLTTLIIIASSNLVC